LKNCYSTFEEVGDFRFPRPGYLRDGVSIATCKFLHQFLLLITKTTPPKSSTNILKGSAIAHPEGNTYNLTYENEHLLFAPSAYRIGTHGNATKFS
jgi:hypothetical protein